ncbi:MAG: phage minor head protein [Peptococcaceae bacterium]|nr:phage minor head protein [Peptococcaceae bacterium]
MDKTDFTFLAKDAKFEAAIKYFGKKLPVTAREFYKLAAEYQARAFTIASYSKAEIIKQFYELLKQCLENGQTLEDFRRQANEFQAGAGYRDLTAFRAETVFRTNIQTAYQVGHYQAMTDPQVKRLRPYWQYRAVNDHKTRPAHRAMNGRVFPADHPIWDTWYPPNGFKCRCLVVTLSERQVRERGLRVETEAPRAAILDGNWVNIMPDAHFQTNPATAPWQPVPINFPPALRTAYLRSMESTK